ncbi:MAG: rod shape-determining protein MreD [Rhodospirillales bacterium]
MSPEWQRVDTAARSVAPAALTAALVFLNALPLTPPALTPVLPVLALAGVYHWAINRPELLPAWAVFLTGVLQDTLSGAPMGLYTLLFLGVYGGALSQRRFFAGKAFIVIWVGFALAAGLAALLAWLLSAMLHGRLLDPAPVLFQFLLTISVYPLISWALLRFQNAALPVED